MYLTIYKLSYFKKRIKKTKFNKEKNKNITKTLPKGFQILNMPFEIYSNVQKYSCLKE